MTQDAATTDRKPGLYGRASSLGPLVNAISRAVTMVGSGCWYHPTGRQHFGGAAHDVRRVLWYVMNGIAPLSLQSTCGKAWCVNPDHLEAQEVRVQGPRERTLDRHMVAAARREVRAGRSISSVARTLGVPKDTLRQAVRGDTWRDVAEPPVVTRADMARPWF